MLNPIRNAFRPMSRKAKQCIWIVR